MKKYTNVLLKNLSIYDFDGTPDEVISLMQDIKKEIAERGLEEPRINAYIDQYYDSNEVCISVVAKQYETDEQYERRVAKRKEYAEKIRARQQLKKQQIKEINDKRRKILGLLE